MSDRDFREEANTGAQDESFGKERSTSAKGAAEDVAAEAKESASVLKDEAVKQAREAGSLLRDRAKRTFDEGKGQVAAQVGSVAASFRRSGEQLRSDNHRDLARYNDLLAERVEEVADYLRERDADGIWRDVERTARRQPVLFFGGLLALGLVSAQFLRPSQRERYPARDRGRRRTSTYQRETVSTPRQTRVYDSSTRVYDKEEEDGR